MSKNDDMPMNYYAVGTNLELTNKELMELNTAIKTIAKHRGTPTVTCAFYLPGLRQEPGEWDFRPARVLKIQKIKWPDD